MKYIEEMLREFKEKGTVKLVNGIWLNSSAYMNEIESLAPISPLLAQPTDFSIKPYWLFNQEGYCEGYSLIETTVAKVITMQLNLLHI